MGVEFHVIAASDAELQEAFCTQTPVESRTAVKHFDEPAKNPFTGERLEGSTAGPREVVELVPIGRPYAELHPPPPPPLWRRLLGLAPPPSDQFLHLPHASFRTVDHFTLGELIHSLGGPEAKAVMDSMVTVVTPLEHDPRVVREPSDESIPNTRGAAPDLFQIWQRGVSCGVDKLCDDSTARLARINDDETAAAAERWLREPVAASVIPPDETAGYIDDLRRLARFADEQQKSLFLYVTL